MQRFTSQVELTVNRFRRNKMFLHSTLQVMLGKKMTIWFQTNTSCSSEDSIRHQIKYIFKVCHKIGQDMLVRRRIIPKRNTFIFMWV